uniref:SbsA Ig-like domain-containing protein n=1 Tax=Magallana gigas TaxID=29159 RepID=A0A8W8JUR3_MAGGI|nr:extensin [Crassostrea gigas]
MAGTSFALVCCVVVLPSVAGYWWSNQNQNLNNNVNVNPGFYDPPPAPAPEPPAPAPKKVVHATKDTVVSINFHAPIKNKFIPTLNIGGFGGGPAPKAPSASPKKKKTPKSPRKERGQNLKRRPLLQRRSPRPPNQRPPRAPHQRDLHPKVLHLRDPVAPDMVYP